MRTSKGCAVPLSVKISDRQQRDRLANDLKVVRAQIKEMSAIGPGPRQHRDHFAAILKSARANARELAKAIQRFDMKFPTPKRHRRKD